MKPLGTIRAGADATMRASGGASVRQEDGKIHDVSGTEAGGVSIAHLASRFACIIDVWRNQYSVALVHGKVRDGKAMIRQARSDDIDAVATLFAELAALHDHRAPTGRMNMSLEQRRRALADAREDPNCAIFVSMQDGAMQGAVLVRGQPSAAHAVSRFQTVFVTRLFVAQAARRRGVGSELLAHATSWAREKGAEEVGVSVAAGNAAALRFYAARGFATQFHLLSRAVSNS